MNSEIMGTVGPILVMVAIFYFLLYRPQKKQQKQRRNMLDSLHVGDKIVTIGGIYGTIEQLHEKTLQLKIADHVVIELARSCVNAVVHSAGGKA